MAIKINVTGIEEINKLMEEMKSSSYMDSFDALRYASQVRGPDWYRDKVEIPPLPPLPRFESEEDIEEGSPDPVEWKTTRVASRPVWGIDFSEPLPTILEARSGEDGIFRVEGETDLEKEAERIYRELGNQMQEDINDIIRGMWDPETWDKYK